MSLVGIFARHFGRVAAVGLSYVAALVAVLTAVKAVPIVAKHDVGIALVVGIALLDYAANTAAAARRFWRETGERA